MSSNTERLLDFRSEAGSRWQKRPGACRKLRKSRTGSSSKPRHRVQSNSPRLKPCCQDSPQVFEAERHFCPLNYEGARMGTFDVGRRSVALSIAAGIMVCDYSKPSPAEAALVQFPVSELHNRYLLVRAGQGVREGQGIVFTNPVSKTSIDSGLDDTGKRQVVKLTAPALRDLGAADTPWLWAGINQRSYQTAEILAALFQVGQSRIVPEYSFLDARGLGALEGQSLAEVDAIVAAGDLLGPSWKMEPNTNGTPNESVYDILVRVRQMMSVIETQFSGEDIIIISPDSDNLSILQAAVIGADLRQHRKFAFLPGEVQQLKLAAMPRDDSPVQFACARPPACN